jgi:hypothetical protein
MGRIDRTIEASMAEGSHRPRLTAYRLGDFGISVVPAPTARDWMSKTDQRFANRCLPLLIANQSGWVILNNVSFSAEWAGGDGVDATSISHAVGQPPPLAGSYFGYGIVTWSIPFVFRTPPGFNLLVRGPANSPKDGVCALEGVVESDWTSSTFTMNWKITRPFTPIRFEADEPICMIVPQRRGELEEFLPEIRSVDMNAEMHAQHRAWASSREEFLRALGSKDGERGGGRWQRHYFQGRQVGEEEAHPEHQTSLRIRPFGGMP